MLPPPPPCSAAACLGPVARAAQLRESGNASFKAGRFEAALGDYMAALQETPCDCRLYLNISFTHLKMGNINEVGQQRAKMHVDMYSSTCSAAGATHGIQRCTLQFVLDLLHLATPANRSTCITSCISNDSCSQRPVLAPQQGQHNCCAVHCSCRRQVSCNVWCMTIYI